MNRSATQNSNRSQTDDAGAISLRLFGGFTLVVTGREIGGLSRAAKELFALLVLRGDRNAVRASLAERLWPDAARDRALFYLRRTLTELRAALGPERGRITAPDAATLRLDRNGMECDLCEFDLLGKRAGEADLKQAIAWYRGDLLEDHDAEWITPERAVRAEQFIAALEALAEVEEKKGKIQEASLLWQRVISADPLRESAVRRLMTLKADAGDAAGMERLYRELRRRLWNDLHLEPSGETVALHKALQMQARAVPAIHARSGAQTLPASALSPRSLPIPLTSLVGRVAEAQAVQEALQTHRMVTLVGPGGVGKTRLSLLAADALRATYADGVAFADLTPAKNEEEAALAILNALAVSTDSEVSLHENLRRGLASRFLLLLLDNAEHIAEATAKIVADLLQNCSALAVLCTSRQPLFVSGESVLPVTPLAVPELPDGYTDSAAYLKTLSESESVALLLLRVRASAPAFRLTAKNAPDVARICRQLDGLPLALELAAARFRSLPPAAIAARLESKVQLLNSGDINLPRHRTLHAALDWSYDLLDQAERRLLRHLALFRGGWTLEAAEAVCPVEVEEVDALLAALVDKSLVVYEVLAEDVPRYHLLEMTRQYAIERLDAQEHAALRARLAAYYLQFAQDADASHNLSGNAAWSYVLQQERDNFRATHEWHCERAPETALWLEFFLYFTSVWIAPDVRYWIDRLRTNPMPATPLGLLVTFQTACWAVWQGDVDGETLLRRVLREAEECGDARWQLHALNLLTYMEAEQNNHAAVVEYSERLLALLPADADLLYRNNIAGRAALGYAHLGKALQARAEMEQRLADGLYRDRWEEIFPALDTLVEIARLQGDYAAARAYGQQAALYTEMHCPAHLPNLYRSLAHAALAMQDYAAAWKDLETALEISWRHHAPDREGWVRYDMAELAFQQDERADALRHLGECIALFQAHYEPRSVAQCLFKRAKFCVAWHEAERAAVLIGSAERAFEEYRFVVSAKEEAFRADLTAETRCILGSELWKAAWERGRQMTLAQAVTWATLETQTE